VGSLLRARSRARQHGSRRIYIIRYHSSADDISGAFAPSGLNLDVKNVNTVYFAYIPRLSAHLDLELAGGCPPKTETVAKGPATVGSVPYDGQIIATAKWFSPTLLLNYKFLDEASPVRSAALPSTSSLRRG